MMLDSTICDLKVDEVVERRTVLGGGREME